MGRERWRQIDADEDLVGRLHARSGGEIQHRGQAEYASKGSPGGSAAAFHHFPGSSPRHQSERRGEEIEYLILGAKSHIPGCWSEAHESRSARARAWLGADVTPSTLVAHFMANAMVESPCAKRQIEDLSLDEPTTAR